VIKSRELANFYPASEGEMKLGLRMLAERGSCTFTELNDACRVSAGTLAYHLDVMRELISKTGDDYCLTTIGRFAYELVTQVKDFYKEIINKSH
jgi:predicted transcriptional regulator